MAEEPIEIPFKGVGAGLREELTGIRDGLQEVDTANKNLNKNAQAEAKKTAEGYNQMADAVDRTAKSIDTAAKLAGSKGITVIDKESLTTAKKLETTLRSTIRSGGDLEKRMKAVFEVIDSVGPRKLKEVLQATTSEFQKLAVAYRSNDPTRVLEAISDLGTPKQGDKGRGRGVTA